MNIRYLALGLAVFFVVLIAGLSGAALIWLVRVISTTPDLAWLPFVIVAAAVIAGFVVSFEIFIDRSREEPPAAP